MSTSDKKKEYNKMYREKQKLKKLAETEDKPGETVKDTVNEIMETFEESSEEPEKVIPKKEKPIPKKSNPKKSPPKKDESTTDESSEESVYIREPKKIKKTIKQKHIKEESESDTENITAKYSKDSVITQDELDLIIEAQVKKKMLLLDVDKQKKSSFFFPEIIKITAPFLIPFVFQLGSRFLQDSQIRHIQTASTPSQVSPVMSSPQFVPATRSSGHLGLASQL